MGVTVLRLPKGLIEVSGKQKKKHAAAEYAVLYQAVNSWSHQFSKETYRKVDYF